jgi:putative DNA primase/helicase
MDLYYYLQKAAGYSILTGDIAEQKVFCLLGEGRNGKSLFINTLAEIAGDYANKIEASVLCTNRFGDKDNDTSKELYRIKGSRFIYSNEFGRSSILNENFIKTITDGGKIACRPLYGASIEYKPTYTLWFSTNHMPNLNAMDEGIRRRVVVIPFRNHLTEAQIDRTLADKFRAEYPAILTWLIQGYDLYQKHGLVPPQAVQEATKGYFTEQDVFKMFVDENYVVDEFGKVKARDLYTHYRQWCEACGEKYVAERLFSQEMQRLHIEKDRLKNANYYRLSPK